MKRSFQPGRRLFATAALLASFTLHGAALADVPINESARVHFKAGVNLLQDPSGARYEEAYREFKAAYADSPSPRILGNMGLCAMKLERDGEAIKAYEGYLAGVPDLSPDERKQIERDLATLRASAVRVRVKINVPGASLVDVRVPVQGGSITNVYGPVQNELEIRIRPGNHTMTAKLRGYPAVNWEFDAQPGANLDHTFELKADAGPSTPGPAVERSRPIPTYVWIAGAGSLALAAAGTVTGILALSKNSDFKTANTGTNPAEAEDIRSSGQTMNVLTDVFLASALVGAGVTAALFFTRPTVEKPVQTGAFMRVEVGATPSGGGARLIGTF
jgi:hypothetical protein